MKFNQVLSNFSAGIWSDKMRANTEVDQYKRSCKELQNMFVQKEGGAFQRPGFQYKALPAPQQAIMDAQAYSTKIFALVGKESGVRTQYILFINAGVPTATWFCYNTTTGAILTMSIYPQVNNARTGEVSWAYSGEYFIAAFEDGKEPIVVTVVDGTCYVVGISDAPTGGTYAYYTVPYNTPNILGEGNPQTITSSAAVGVVTLTASSAFFTPAMVDSAFSTGTFIKLTSAGVTGVALITATPAGAGPHATCTAAVIRDVPVVACGIAAGTFWEISAWNGHYGWPTKVTAFEQRIYYGGKPETNTKAVDHSYVWGSRAGDIWDMMEVPLAQDPYFTTYASDNSRPFSFVASKAVGSVRGLSATKVLVVGYSDKEMTVRGTQNALGPLDITIDSNSSYGMSGVQPISIDSNTLYAQSGGQAVRQLVFSYQNEQYNSEDVGYYANISDSKQYNIKKLVPIKIGDTSALFIVFKKQTTNIYRAMAASIDQQNSVGAWSFIRFGSDAGTVNDPSFPIIDATATFPYGNDQGKLYAIAEYASAYYLVKMAPIYEKPTYLYNDMFYYLDMFTDVYPGGSATVAATPFSNGTIVHYFCDGIYKGTTTVSGGNITVDKTTYRSVIYGIAYIAKIVPSPIKTITQFGNSQGKNVKIDTLYIKFLNTLAAYYGDAERSEYYRIPFEIVTADTNSYPPFFNDEKRMAFPPGHSREKLLEIKNELPVPMNVLSIAAEGVVYD